MPQIDEKNLAKIQKLLAVVDEDTLTRDEFVKHFSQVIDLVAKIQERQAQAINDLERTYANLLNKSDSIHSENFNTLKGQVDNLFVGDQLKRMDKETKVNFENLRSFINSQIDKKIKEIDGGISRINESEKTVKGSLENSTKVIADTLNQKTKEMNEYMRNTVNEKSLQKLRQEIFGVIKKIPTRRLGMRRVPIVRAVDLSGDVNGTATTFTLPRDTVRVLGVWSTQFPISFRQDVDWTFAGNTLTLVQNQVGVPASGQTLWALVEVLFYS